MRFRPGAVAALRHPEYEHDVRIDAVGFRNACTFDGLRAVNVGDSFVFGVGVDETETLSCQIWRQLGLRTYSMAIPGAGAREYLQILATHGRALVELAKAGARPAELVYVFLGNDVLDLVRARIDRRAPQPRIHREPTVRRTLATLNRAVFHDSLLRHSYLLNLAKLALVPSVIGEVSSVDHVVLREGTAVFRRNLDESIRSAHRRLIRTNLGLIDDAARRAGFGAVTFVLLPPLVFLDGDALTAELGLQGHDAVSFDSDYPRRAIVEAAGSRLDVFDPGPCLRRHPNLDALYFDIDNHLTSRGVTQLVRCMAGLMGEVASDGATGTSAPR